ncbi:hypothetical protein JK636_13415 [Clostridium sp. YIM B02515]|uniref:Oxaloacetate decarboxylase, gamma chain n=1 Tax=Clostridium rhizosphaerae TaxID=2803861 RepID=A0ABS1TD96_9CLOT|nr:OadG-related small transporter subunit [Clostridium rhizosphaerae]MBL4936757.1 hypothetical protein [Clostridium rhizosphaerae]
MSAEVYKNFIDALFVMLKGMGGIFIVLIAIYCSIKFLVKMFPEKR